MILSGFLFAAGVVAFLLVAPYWRVLIKLAAVLACLGLAALAFVAIVVVAWR